MKRPLLVITAVVCIALMLLFAVGPLAAVHPGLFWAAVIALVVIAAAAALRGRAGSRGGVAGSGEFLCDTCKLNDARYCSRPERPNATRCPEYRGRG